MGLAEPLYPAAEMRVKGNDMQHMGDNALVGSIPTSPSHSAEVLTSRHTSCREQGGGSSIWTWESRRWYDMLVIFPPHGSRIPSAFGNFLFEQWKDHRRCKVTARIAPAEWYSTHCLRMFEGGASRAHTIAPRSRDSQDLALDPKGGWWNYRYSKDSTFFISNHGHDDGFSSHLVETTVIGFNKAWVRAMAAHRRGERKASGSNPNEDDGP